jgi:hypothetical protein
MLARGSKWLEAWDKSDVWPDVSGHGLPRAFL